MGLAEALVFGTGDGEVGFEGGYLGEEGVALFILGGVVVERPEAAELGGGECWNGIDINSLAKLAGLAREANIIRGVLRAVGRASWRHFERGKSSLVSRRGLCSASALPTNWRSSTPYRTCGG